MNAMGKTQLALLLLLLICLVLPGCPPNVPPIDIPPEEGECIEPTDPPDNGQVIIREEVEAAVFEYVNAVRVDEGLTPLIYDADVSAVALAHSKDMFDRSYLDHKNPEGLRPCDRLTQAGITWSHVGETIFYTEGYSPEKIAAMTIDAWMESPSHRKVLLNPVYTHSGLGVFRTPCGRFYVTEMYLKKK